MINVMKEPSVVRYVIEFGDSQRPEKFIFTEAEAKLLHKKLKEALYPAMTGP
jgi:hypothetical protein